MNFNGGYLASTGYLVTGIPLVTGPGTVNLNGPATIDTGTNVNAIDSVIAGTGSLFKQSAGTLTLSQVNTYGGGTKIIAGVLNLTNNLALQNSAHGHLRRRSRDLGQRHHHADLWRA